jgi:hypothetical protein
MVDAVEDTNALHQEWLVRADNLYVRRWDTNPGPVLSRIEFSHGIQGQQVLHKVVELDPRPSVLPCSAVLDHRDCCLLLGVCPVDQHDAARRDQLSPVRIRHHAHLKSTEQDPAKIWSLTRYVHFGHLNVCGSLILTPGPKGIVTHRQKVERKKDDDSGRKEVLLGACLPQKRSSLGISANGSELPRRPKIVSSLGIHVEAEIQKWSHSHSSSIW